MAMTLFLHDPLDDGNSFERLTLQPMAPQVHAEEHFHLLQEKIAVPAAQGLLSRPRLEGMVERSLHQYPATLISGRSGTGKTGLASQAAAKYKKVAWYTLDALDVDWSVFRSYFAESVSSACGARRKPRIGADRDTSGHNLAQFLIETFSVLPARSTSRLLIVIDDLHHVFDAPWFAEFFQLLLLSLPPEVHLLLLCRSKPPSPLWRLRSKQVLNVIDEKLLAFTGDEASQLLKPTGLPAVEVERVLDESFGRVVDLVRARSS
jgi:LuxR family maltose regulon positive regulatory protein